MPDVGPFLENLPRQAVAAGVLSFFITAIAYTHSPRLKMLIFSIPVPFTCAYLASRIPVDTTHLFAFVLGAMYHSIVYLLRVRFNIPIILAILLAIGVYFIIGSQATMLRHVPYLWVAAGMLVAWLAWIVLYHPTVEPGHRSRAPWWLKFPGTFLIAMVIMNLVGLLAGAAVSFPFAGVFTSYEMRHSLRTLRGQFIINVMNVCLVVTTIWALQDVLPKPWPLVLGWIPALACMIMIYALGLGRPKQKTPVPAEP